MSAGGWQKVYDPCEFALKLVTGEELEPVRDNVEHYSTGEIECIDYIFDKLGYDGGRDFILANILKYASRAKHKGQFDADIEKIRNYAVILQEKTAQHKDALAQALMSTPDDGEPEEYTDSEYTDWGATPKGDYPWVVFDLRPTAPQDSDRDNLFPNPLTAEQLRAVKEACMPNVNYRRWLSQ